MNYLGDQDRTCSDGGCGLVGGSLQKSRNGWLDGAAQAIHILTPQSCKLLGEQTEQSTAEFATSTCEPCYLGSTGSSFGVAATPLG